MTSLHSGANIFLHAGYDHSWYRANDHAVADVLSGGESNGDYDYSAFYRTPGDGDDVPTVDTILSWDLTEDLNASAFPLTTSNALTPPTVAAPVGLVSGPSSSKINAPVASASHNIKSSLQSNSIEGAISSREASLGCVAQLTSPKTEIATPESSAEPAEGIHCA